MILYSKGDKFHGYGIYYLENELIYDGYFYEN